MRYVDLPDGGGTARAHHAGQRLRPHQADHLRPGSLANLDAAIDEALAPRRRRRRRGHRQAVHLRRRRRPQGDAGRRHAASRRSAIGRSATTSSASCADARVPTFAFVNGAAMGGGLEVALHCHYRTLSAGVPALALPEVFLGLVPGWGGTPAAAEPDRRRQGGHGHHREPAEPEQHAQGPSRPSSWASPTRCSSRPTSWSSRWRGPPSVVRGETVVAAPRGRPRRGLGPGRSPAAKRHRRHARCTARPRRRTGRSTCIELAAHARRTTTGIAAEDEALADLIMGDELRAGLYAFDLVQRRAKRPAGAPDKCAGPRRSPRSASSAPA